MRSLAPAFALACAIAACLGTVTARAAREKPPALPMVPTSGDRMADCQLTLEPGASGKPRHVVRCAPEGAPDSELRLVAEERGGRGERLFACLIQRSLAFLDNREQGDGSVGEIIVVLPRDRIAACVSDGAVASTEDGGG